MRATSGCAQKARSESPTKRTHRKTRLIRHRCANTEKSIDNASDLYMYLNIWETIITMAKLGVSRLNMHWMLQQRFVSDVMFFACIPIKRLFTFSHVCLVDLIFNFNGECVRAFYLMGGSRGCHYLALALVRFNVHTLTCLLVALFELERHKPLNATQRENAHHAIVEHRLTIFLSIL